MRLFAIAILLATAALLCWAWQLSGSVTGPTKGAREPATEVVNGVAVPEATAPAHQIERQASEAGDTVLEVVDERGAALNAVGVWKASNARRVYKRDAPGFVGSTNERGRLALDVPGTVVVGKRGFLPQSVDIALGAHQRVELQRSPILEVLCVEEGTRRPVADVELIVAASVLPSDWSSSGFDSYVGEVPSPDASLAVLALRSSPEGVLRVEGLPQCVPQLHVRRRGFGIVDGPGIIPPDNERMAIPGRYTLVLTPLVACGFRVIGDELIKTRGGFTNARAGGLVGWEASHTRAALQQKFPGATIFVAARGPAPGPSTVDLTMQLASKGEHEASFDFMTVTEFEARGPVEFDAASLQAGEKAGAVPVIVHVVNGDGLPLVKRELMLLPESGGIQPATSSKSFLVAPGTYRVTALESTINHSLPENCEIRVAPRISREATPQEFQIQMTRTLYRVEFLRIPFKGVRDSVKLTHANGGLLNLSFAGKDSIEAYLPEGEITAKFFSPLGGELLSTFNVERSAKSQTVRLVQDH